MTFYTDTNTTIEIGDIVRHAGMEGPIVAVLDDAKFSIDFSASTWGYLETGIIAVFKEAGTIHFPKVDAGVKFLRRQS